MGETSRTDPGAGILPGPALPRARRARRCRPGGRRARCPTRGRPPRPARGGSLSKSATKTRIEPERRKRIVDIPRFSSRSIPPRSAFVADLDTPQPRVTTGVPPAPRRRPQNNLPVLYMGKFLLETYVLGIVAKSCGKPRIDPRGRRSPMCNTTARTEKKLPGHCAREPFRQCPRNRPREKPARPYPAESPTTPIPAPFPVVALREERSGRHIGCPRQSPRDCAILTAARSGAERNDPPGAPFSASDGPGTRADAEARRTWACAARAICGNPDRRGGPRCRRA